MQRRRPHRALICLLCLGLLACSETPEEAPPEAARSPRSAAPEIPQDFVVTLERTLNLDDPAYVVSADAGGTVRYTGTRWVETEGEAEGRIRERPLRRILAQLEEMDFFALKDEYAAGEDCREWWFHHGSQIVEVRLRGAHKRVHHYTGCKGFEEEDALRRLGEVIERETGVGRWIGNPENSKEGRDRALLEEFAEKARRARAEREAADP